MWVGEEGRKAYNDSEKMLKNWQNEQAYGSLKIRSKLDIATDAMLELSDEDLIELQNRIDLKLEESLK